jgi:hypothetical protein
MDMVIQFPAWEEKIIKELDFTKFTRKLNYYKKKGYKAIRKSTYFKITGFGKVTGYFAELRYF